MDFSGRRIFCTARRLGFFSISRKTMPPSAGMPPAVRWLDSGGILVTCSCSHHFSESMLLETVAEAALDSGRTLRVLERRTQSQDHPILLTVPETHYLKCVVLQVV